MVELGDKVKDRVTGFEGIVIGIHLWLYGCRRISIQPQELKDGKPIEAISIDEPQCEILERGAVSIPEQQQKQAPKEKAPRTGGPPTDAKAGARPSVKR